ncbi:hypothetical protein AXG93_4530s1180 [Marchantia polymorpha subsp. ruderalis]|uniref:Uncharacterized protein n=1 Tax=Marchantia polymorpha subsp. ruderalis TaxID=1480154 RepID=A0A176VX03_MARPO|nr:hypothetical protein AXG93_4530s1180 [Marchantia polymorpha subsp. ruderalis]
MVPLRVTQIGLQAFQDELMAVKLDFLLWRWNWVCPAMVREWLREKNQPPRRYRPHQERWQVGFVELALAGTPIHWARMFLKATRQHAQEDKGGSINHISPLLINFYRSMGCLIATERVQFPLLSRANPRRYVRDVEVNTDSDEVPASTPPARPRADDKPREVRAPRKRKWDGDADMSQREVPTAPVQEAHREQVLAGHGVKAGAEEATPLSSRESPRISEATEILETEDDTPSEEEEVELVRGTTTGVLCEQMVPLLRYLVRKTTKYADYRHRESYVELKAALQLRDDVAANAQREIEELCARIETEINSERAQNRILAEELVRQMRALEKSETARKADEELLCRLQSQCDELRAPRAEAELQLEEVEGHNRRVTDRTREEFVSRVDRCFKGYARWKIATRERMTLRKMEIRAAALMSDDSQSRRHVAKRLESLLSRSRDAIANLEA